MLDTESVNLYLDHAMNADLIAVDTETTGIEHIKDGRDYLQGMSLAYRLGGPASPKMSCYLPFRHSRGDNLVYGHYADRIKLLLETKPLVFHNRKFDRHSLSTLDNFTFNGPQFCTMIMAHLNNEEEYSKGLDHLSKKYLGERKLDTLGPWAKIVGWENITPEMTDEYAQQDACLTLDLQAVMWQKLIDQQLDKLWWHEIDFMDCLYDMERLGIDVDLDFCAKKVEFGTKRMDEITKRLGLNPGSTDQLKKLFFDELHLPVFKYTPGGKPSLTKDVLEDYDLILGELGDPRAKQVLEYRGWQKSVSSFYSSIINKVSPDGKVRTNFKQHGTVTGRLSSSEPNLQQIPRNSKNPWNGDAKRAFSSGDPDFELRGYDYSQLELRLGTAYGKDPWLIEAFANPNSDVFEEMSQRIGVPRQTCKTFTYANLYGAGLEKIALTLNKLPSEVEQDFEAFKESISGIRSASKIATSRATNRGYITYWSGRKRHFSNRIDDAHKAFNSALQGGAAELVKRTQLRLREYESENCRMVSQIHDEIVFRVRKDLVSSMEPLIMNAMTDWPDFGVTLKVEGKIWNDVPEMELI